MDTSDTKARLTEQFNSAYGKPAASTAAPPRTEGETEHERRVSKTYRGKASSVPPAVSTGQAELDRQVAKTYGLKPPEAPAPQQRATEVTSEQAELDRRNAKSYGLQKPGADAAPTADQKASELKLPEGYDANAPEIESLKAAGFDPAHQEKVLAWHAEQRAAEYKAQDEQVEAWRQAVHADPEIGGEQLAGSIASAKTLIAQFGDKGLREILDGAAGNHPSVIKFIAKVSRALAAARRGD